MSSPKQLLERHHAEMARAAAAAMHGHHQETVEICSELLTGGLYPEMDAAGMREDARRARAECRLLMATAMHYTGAQHDDVLKVLNFALDAPADTQRDAYFTIAVVELSSERTDNARVAMQQCLSLIGELKRAGQPDPEGRMEQQESEALEFLAGLETGEGGVVH